MFVYSHFYQVIRVKSTETIAKVVRGLDGWQTNSNTSLKINNLQIEGKLQAQHMVLFFHCQVLCICLLVVLTLFPVDVTVCIPYISHLFQLYCSISCSSILILIQLVFSNFFFLAKAFGRNIAVNAILSSSFFVNEKNMVGMHDLQAILYECYLNLSTTLHTHPHIHEEHTSLQTLKVFLMIMQHLRQ